MSFGLLVLAIVIVAGIALWQGSKAVARGSRTRQVRRDWVAAAERLLPALDHGHAREDNNRGAHVGGEYRGHKVTIFLDPGDPETDSQSGVRVGLQCWGGDELTPQQRVTAATWARKEILRGRLPLEQWAADPAVRPVMDNLVRAVTDCHQPPRLTTVRFNQVELWAPGAAVPSLPDLRLMLDALYQVARLVPGRYAGLH